MARSKDLFDDSTMTFGEHLESLRMHLFKALIGLLLAVILTLTYGNHLVTLIRTPLDQALKRNGMYDSDESQTFWNELSSWFYKSSSKGAGTGTNSGTGAGTGTASSTKTGTNGTAPPAHPNTIIVGILPSDIVRALHEADPARYPAMAANEGEKPVELPLSAEVFREFRQTSDKMNRPVTLNVQEAFMMYIKVAMISAVIIASPWIFYQLWQFVAAGLYPHERRYVHIYMPLSIGLFLVGVVFCFYIALPVLLDFLLSYNRWLQVVPQLRLSEWVGFVVVLPLMFGISFQLPLVMLFLERISVFKASDYRLKRRLAIFVIAVLAMVLSPGGDPGSMLLMFIPLVILYEFGIVLCGFGKPQQSFEQPAVG